MTDTITLSRESGSEIFRAVNGIGELLKTIPAKPENAAVTYAIMSNLAVIRMNLAGVPRVGQTDRQPRGLIELTNDPAGHAGLDMSDETRVVHSDPENSWRHSCLRRDPCAGQVAV